MGMDRHGIRYLFEHRLLPNWFYEEKGKFVILLLEDEETLFRIINSIFEKEDMVNPYAKDQFEVDSARITDDVFMVKITLPEPEEEPLCYCIFLFFDKGFNKMGFFCIEKGGELSDDLPFVCSWDKEGNHLNHGNCSFDEDEDFLRCSDIFMEREFGLKRH